MSVKQLKAGAMLVLALAVGAIAFALWASDRRVKIQGPSAVAVLPDGAVWVSVDDRLWRLDAQGRRQLAVAAAAHGVPGLIGNLVAHPGGQLVASTRDDPALYFLDPATGAARSRLLPAWPADLQRHGGRAITYAFHPDGRVAISTGGGHAVALFDAAGRFVARTVPGTYQFSNGLWWSGETLWTTDTNRFALVELDGRTLAEKSRVQLRSGTRGWRYLGMAAGAPPGAPPEVLGSIVRFANGMIRGHVVDVLRDGSQKEFPTVEAMEPRDVKWRGNELLVVDGARYAIARFSADRRPLPDFGDAAVLAELAAMPQTRASLKRQYHAGLAAAVALLVAGLLLAMRAQAVERSAGAPEPRPGQAARMPAATLASLAIPGLGQWMQRRRAVALLFFLCWAVLVLALVVPLVWTVLGPRAAVSNRHIADIALAYVLLCGLAAFDAWRGRVA